MSVTFDKHVKNNQPIKTSQLEQNVHYNDLQQLEKEYFREWCCKKLRAKNKSYFCLHRKYKSIKRKIIGFLFTEKLEPINKSFYNLHKELLESAPSSKHLFLVYTDPIYFYSYPKKFHESHFFSIDKMTLHQKAALFMGYLRYPLDRVIPKNLMREIKNTIKNRTTGIYDAVAEITLYLPFALPKERYDVMKMVFDIWNALLLNQKGTDVSIDDLCEIFLPIFFDSRTLKSIDDKASVLYFLKILYQTNFLYIYNSVFNQYRLYIKEIMKNKASNK